MGTANRVETVSSIRLDQVEIYFTINSDHGEHLEEVLCDIISTTGMDVLKQLRTQLDTALTGLGHVSGYMEYHHVHLMVWVDDLTMVSTAFGICEKTTAAWLGSNKINDWTIKT